MSASYALAKFGTTSCLGSLSSASSSSPSTLVPTWLLHRINTDGRQVTVHRYVVVKSLISHATELLPFAKSIVVIFIPHCDVTNI
jgi:hypothetical protein